MSNKSSDRKGPWHHAAVAALQGATIEEQLQFLDPDLVEQADIDPGDNGAQGLGFGVFGAEHNPSKAKDEVRPPALSHERGAQIWGRWDVHTRGKVVR